ncbi:MAG: hypothetical protein Q4B58_02740 [Bacteroidales bacterium]|nr:hypothetical protein [Bacteroidales bacterium]
MDSKYNSNEDNAKVVNHNEMHNCNVFQGDSYGGIFPLPGAQVTIIQNLDPKKQKKGEGCQVEGKAESLNDREERKQMVLDDIISRFNFDESMLARDEQGHQITTLRIQLLFSKILGMRGAHPGQNGQAIVEVLWTLLMDERNQCSKHPNEGFFRQTVLNLIGYFVSNGLVCGQPRVVARAIFPGTDTNEARNISRGISSPVFPEGTADHIDLYIEKLHNGEI